MGNPPTTSTREGAYFRLSFLEAGGDMWFYTQGTVDQFVYFLVPSFLDVRAYRMDSDYTRKLDVTVGDETTLLEIFVVGDTTQDALDELARRIQSELNETTRMSTRDRGSTVFRVMVTQVGTPEDLPEGGTLHNVSSEHMKYGRAGALEAVDVDVWGAHCSSSADARASTPVTSNNRDAEMRRTERAPSGIG